MEHIQLQSLFSPSFCLSILGSMACFVACFGFFGFMACYVHLPTTVAYSSLNILGFPLYLDGFSSINNLDVIKRLLEHNRWIQYLSVIKSKKQGEDRMWERGEERRKPNP